MPTNHDTAWLDKLHEDFVEALRSNDIDALGASYAEDAVLLPPARAVVAGRAAIVEFWKGAERFQDLVFEATDSRMLGGGKALRETGNLLITSRGQGRDTFNTAAKYIAVWVELDGRWKIDSLAWSGASGGRGGGRGRRRGGGGGDGGGGRGGEGGGRQGGGGGRGRQGGGGGGRGGGGQGRGGRQGGGRG